MKTGEHFFGKEEDKTVRQTAKEHFFLCLNMLFISEILMIRPSAQVKSLSATLVVHRVYEPHLREQVEVFFFSSKSPFHLAVTLSSYCPSQCGEVLAPGRDEPFPPLHFCSSLLPLLFGAQALQYCGLGSHSSVMEGISLSYGEQVFLYMYWFLMCNCILKFLRKNS